MRIKGITIPIVRKVLRSEFNIDVKSIDYVPIGENSASYRIKTKKGEKYFCSVNNNLIQLNCSTPLPEVLNFLNCVHQKYGVSNVPKPIFNKRNRLISRVKGKYLVLYEYIDGKNLRNISKFHKNQIGKVLKVIHSIDVKEFKNIPVENLDMKWEKRIQCLIRVLKNSTYSEKSINRQLQKILLEKENILLNSLEFVLSLRSYVLKRKKRFRLTHGDLWEGNLITSKEKAWIIDWDDIVKALPEKDLMWFMEKDKMDAAFSSAYGKYKIDFDALNFYRARRWIGDVVYWGEKTLRGEVTRGEFLNVKKMIEHETNELKRILK